MTPPWIEQAEMRVGRERRRVRVKADEARNDVEVYILVDRSGQ